jgi:predicted metalloprotease with PDZ domain
MTFTATDYDTLVDAPTEMGNFDVTKFEANGKPHYFVANPAGAFSTEKSKKFVELLARMAKAESDIFGVTPYEKYIHFYFFARPESNAGGALEHLNSFVSFAPRGDVATPERLIGTAAHEFFHLWNVKRIRPVEMWPYDYSRENETPLLWVSEGFTNYYEHLALYRAGIHSGEDFLNSVRMAIEGVEGNEARHYISPAESSSSTWIGYDTPVAFEISYYTQGQNLGALLDLSIINDTAGRASLDDVMRALYREFYLHRRGYNTEDMIAIINRLTRRDYHEFYAKYVWGIEVPSYEKILGYAGYKVEKSTLKTFVLGMGFQQGAEGIRITNVRRNGAAAEAGLMAGDLLLGIDGVDVNKDVGALAERLNAKIGQTVKVAIKRGEELKSLSMKVGGNDRTQYKITESANATPAQLKVREKWLATTR